MEDHYFCYVVSPPHMRFIFCIASTLVLLPDSKISVLVVKRYSKQCRWKNSNQWRWHQYTIQDSTLYKKARWLCRCFIFCDFGEVFVALDGLLSLAILFGVGEGATDSIAVFLDHFHLNCADKDKMQVIHLARSRFQKKKQAF